MNLSINGLKDVGPVFDLGETASMKVSIDSKESSARIWSCVLSIKID
jgi:hypothetical protein